MVTVQFDFYLYYIVHKKANCYNNSVAKDSRKLMGLPRAAGENLCVINSLQNSTRFLRPHHEKVSKILRRKVDSKRFLSYQ